MLLTDVAFESGNIFDDKRIVLRRDQDLITNRINSHRRCAELERYVAAIGGFQDTVIVPDVTLVEHLIRLLFMNDDRGTTRPERVKKKGIGERSDKITNRAQQKKKESPAHTIKPAGAISRAARRLPTRCRSSPALPAPGDG